MLAQKRRRFSWAKAGVDLRIILFNPVVMVYTFISGLVFSVLMAYLSVSQDLFQYTYALGDWFPAFFSLLALAIGIASFVNGQWVMKLGMQYICQRALWVLTLSSVLMFFVANTQAGLPSLWLTGVYFFVMFFCLGMLFGNLNALAMEPLGDMAGMGAAVVGGVSALVAVPIGIGLGQQYHGTVMPLVVGFTLCGGLSLSLMFWLNQHQPPPQGS